MGQRKITVPILIWYGLCKVIFFFEVGEEPGIELRALYLLSLHSTTDPHPSFVHINLKTKLLPAIVLYDFNPSTQEARTGGFL